MHEMHEGPLYDHIRELERKLRSTTPASQADLDDVNERLRKIERSIAAVTATIRNAGDLTELQEAEQTPLAPETRRKEAVHH